MIKIETNSPEISDPSVSEGDGQSLAFARHPEAYQCKRWRCRIRQVINRIRRDGDGTLKKPPPEPWWRTGSG